MRGYELSSFATAYVGLEVPSGSRRRFTSSRTSVGNWMDQRSGLPFDAAIQLLLPPSTSSCAWSPTLTLNSVIIQGLESGIPFNNGSVTVQCPPTVSKTIKVERTAGTMDTPKHRHPENT